MRSPTGSVGDPVWQQVLIGRPGLSDRTTPRSLSGALRAGSSVAPTMLSLTSPSASMRR